MEGKELNKVLKDRAIEFGLCKEWQKEWDAGTTRQELIDKYLRGIDFCIEHDYPKKEFIKKTFPDELLHRNGIFVDEAFSCDGRSPFNTVVLLGDSIGELDLEDHGSWDVYVRHGSVANIRVTEGAKAFIETYDDSVTTVKTDDDSKAFVYQHGGSVTAEGNVTVRDKRKAE